MAEFRRMCLRRVKWAVVLGSILMITGCPKPPQKALTDAEQAILDARGVKDCASDKFKAAQRLLEEAEELSAEEKYDEAERKAKAARKLAVEAKAEGEANWDDCMKKQEVVEKAKGMSKSEEDDEEADEERLSLQTVYFGYDSSDLGEEARQALDENVRWLNKHSDETIVLEGHTDERGTPEYNLSLGESRARRVKQYLIQLGVDGDKISILSYGEEKPAAFGATNSDYAKNRRVEFMPRD